MKSNIRIYENARVPMTPAEQMRDVLRRSARYAFNVSDPFGTGDSFDIFRAIFDSPVSSRPDKPLINWLINSESNNVYPYDYYVDAEHSVSEDDTSKLEKVIHTFEIPVAGFNKSEINVAAILGKLRVTLGNINKSNLEDSPEVVYSDIDALGTKKNTRYYIKKSIKRNFVELQWNIKGLVPENVSSTIVNGILKVSVEINIDTREKTKDMWSSIKVDGNTQNG